MDAMFLASSSISFSDSGEERVRALMATGTFTDSPSGR